LIARSFHVGRKRKAAMRGFISYILAGTAVVIAMGAMAPPVGLGLAAGTWPAVEVAGQVVDRTHKGDRVQVPLVNGRRMLPPRAPAMLIGCEPVFSSLSAGSRANFAGRCVS
jgi:hypothetical protein